jgi:hypothetical protein
VVNSRFLGAVVAWIALSFSANAQKPSADPSFEDLVTTYRKFGLPLPPVAAKLVLFETGAQSSFEGKSGKLHSLGFLLKPGKDKQPPLILVGTQECSPEYPHTWNKVKLVEPDPKLAQEVFPEYHYLTFSLDTALATAIQCKTRGWNDLAKALLEVSLKKDAGHFNGIFYQPDNLSAQSALAYMAWGHWGNELTKSNTDRAAIAGRMKQLLEAEPNLKTKWTEIFFRQLQETVKPSLAKPGSPQALVDDLTNITTQHRWDEYSHKPNDRQVRLLEQGFDAIPVLIEHLDDERLTRAFDLGFNNSPPHFRLVREFVSDVIVYFADENLFQGRARGAYELVEKPSAEKWWANAQKKGEKTYLLENVFPKKAGRTLPNPYMVLVLGKKYPNDLAKLYENVLKEKPQIDTDVIADAISKSTLPMQKKIELFKKGSSHENAGIRKVADTCLKSLESKP